LDYKKAIDRLDRLFDAPIGIPESDEADITALLVDEYEKTHFPIDASDLFMVFQNLYAVSRFFTPSFPKV